MKKLTDEGQLTVNGAGFSLSIGSVLGQESSVTEKSGQERSREEQRPSVAPEGLMVTISRLTMVTLHRQSSGKGGKTVTVVTLSKETSVNLEEMAKEMRKGLGCGARVEDGKVVLQGNIQERAREWLVKKGAKKVVLGN